MLTWSIVFLILAFISAILGFTGFAGTAIWVAHTLFIFSALAFFYFRRRKGRITQSDDGDRVPSRS